MLDEYSLGFPCHKYIARNIETELDMLIFEREFSKVMLSCSFDNPTIEVGLIAMASAVPKTSPIWGKSFDIKGNGVSTGDFVQDLLFDTTIPNIGKCTSFYGKYDSSMKACSICPLSNRYVNTYREQEMAIVHYCLLSEANYNQCLDGGLIATDFHSLFDMSEPFQISKPHTLKLTNIIMSALSKPMIRKAQYSLPEGEVCSELKAEIGKRMARYKLPALLMEKKTQMALMETMLKSIFSTPLPKNSELEQMLSLLKSFKAGKLFEPNKELDSKTTNLNKGKKRKTTKNDEPDSFVQTTVLDLLTSGLESSSNKQAPLNNDSKNNGDVSTNTVADVEEEIDEKVERSENSVEKSNIVSPGETIDLLISGPLFISESNEDSIDEPKEIIPTGIVNIEDLDVEIGGMDMPEVPDISDIELEMNCEIDDYEEVPEESVIDLEEEHTISSVIDSDTSTPATNDCIIVDVEDVSSNNTPSKQDTKTDSVDTFYETHYNNEETNSKKCENVHSGNTNTTNNTNLIIESSNTSKQKKQCNTCVKLDNIPTLISKGDIVRLCKSTSNVLYRLETSVSHDGYISLEVISENNDLYLILWCASTQKFYYCDFNDNMVNEIIYGILTSQRIKKLTLEPYLLYYLASCHNFVIKNLIDLSAVNYVVSGENDISFPNVPFRNKNKFSVNISHIPAYFTVYRKNIPSTGQTITLREALAIKEAIGYSYGNKFIGNTTYIEKVNATSFKFNEPDYSKAIPGKIVMYEFPEIEDVARKLVIELVEKGRFKKCNIQLLSLSVSKVYLYVENSQVDYVLTYIDSIIYEMRLDMQLENLTVNVGLVSVGGQNSI